MNDSSSLVFYPLSVLYDEQQGIMIGRTGGESYAQFPEDAVALLRQLQQGVSLNQATIWYEQQYGEKVDIEDFLITLRDLQFIRDKNEPELTENTKNVVSYQWLGRAIFSFPAWIAYCTLFIFCFYILFRYPSLVPHRQSLFFSPSLILIEGALLFFQILAVLFHESYHVLAGRRLGLPTKITLGHRLGALTLETSLTHLWSVPRRLRYLPLLAGMLADAIAFSVCIIIAWIIKTGIGENSLIVMFFLAMAYSTIWRFAWQFLFYLRTDLYYVVATTLGCIDLQNTTRAYACNLFFKFLGKAERLEDEESWHVRDRRVVRWYLPLHLLGYGFSISILLFVGLPITIQLFSIDFIRLTHGISANPILFVDSTIFLVLNSIPWIVLITSIMRKSKRWRNRQKITRTSGALSNGLD